MAYRVIDKCEFSLLCGFVNDYELIAPVQKGRSYVFGIGYLLSALLAREAITHPLCGWTATCFTKPPFRWILTIVQAVKIRVVKVVVAMAKKAYSLSHTKWMYKYHIVFTLMCRRKIIYNQIRDDVAQILRRLCEYKGIEIIEGHLMPDHVHVLVSMPPKHSVSSVMGISRGRIR